MEWNDTMISSLKTEFILNYIIIKIQFVLHRKHDFSATKTNWLTLFREAIAVYCENHTKHTNAICGQNAEFYCVKAHGTYSDHRALKG
jgi:hypothetical protein